MSESTLPRRPPSYGLDAPGIVRTLLVVGVVGLAIWPLDAAVLLALWWEDPEGLRIVLPLKWPGLCVGVLCLFMGGWMIYYSLFGKVRLRERLLARRSWRGDEAVLDVGCGRGLMLIGSAARLTTGKAVGVDLWQGEDLSGNSPEATKANAEAAGVLDRVEVRTGDARQLPFADASFDVVVSCAALHNIYDVGGRQSALREIVRVLKPGGQVLIADIQHASAYAEVFRASGLTDVECSGPKGLALLMGVLSFGGLWLGTVTARKPA